MTWQELTKDTLPPVDNARFFLLYRGKNDDGGGIMCCAKRVQYDGKAPYIRYIKAFSGWVLLEEDEWEDCLWAAIEYPDCTMS